MLPLINYIRQPKMAVLRVLSRCAGFIKDDESYLRLRFYLEMGKRLDLKNPKTFNEKLQWLKLYNRKAEYSTMVDKHAVKQYIAEKLGEEYVIPTLGVWERPEDIDYSTLPDKFVLKTTHGGGGGGVVICRDKTTFDKNAACAKLNESLRSDIYLHLREWPYKNVPKRIIAERLMEDESGKEFKDYRLFCHDGKVQFCKTGSDVPAHANCLAPDWTMQTWTEQSYAAEPEPPQGCPGNFRQMTGYARELAKDIPFARIDFYNVGGRSDFSGITLNPAPESGEVTREESAGNKGTLLRLPDGGGYLIDYQRHVIHIHPDYEAISILVDYKFFCFDGKTDCVMTCYERGSGSTKFYFFDRDWKLVRCNVRGKNAPEGFTMPQPPNYDKMIALADKLSEGIPFLRLDLYNVNGRILFGEMTFFPQSGFDPNLLPETEQRFGSLINLKT